MHPYLAYGSRGLSFEAVSLVVYLKGMHNLFERRCNYTENNETHQEGLFSVFFHLYYERYCMYGSMVVEEEEAHGQFK